MHNDTIVASVSRFETCPPLLGSDQDHRVVAAHERLRIELSNPRGRRPREQLVLRESGRHALRGGVDAAADIIGVVLTRNFQAVFRASRAASGLDDQVKQRVR